LNECLLTFLATFSRLFDVDITTIEIS